ncbi:MAG TPA: SURF1 family protein [Rhizomicrobium sp.]|jgi:surfeit locus 1 family protein|nr:SURF1 family protein [Rhizomicrobium sp.]
MLYFRPLWKLTVASAILFAILISLGLWQLDRLQWKLSLIAQVNANMHAAPISPEEAIAKGDGAQYHRVALAGRFDNSKEAYVFGTEDGAPVYHVIVPFTTRDDRVFLVDRGIVPKEKIDPATRRAGLIDGDTHVVGVWRTPDPPGLFTPAPDAARRIWFAHDLKSIAKFDGIKVLAASALIEADATPNPGGWPKGGQTVVTFRNEHLQYAITWFGLAAVLFGVYVAYHISRGRLRFGRPVP